MVEKIGPYRVYERLGVGGMGEVFKAYDDRLDRWVAIKRIRPDREDAEDNRERFKREARATARLNHPAIVHLYGIFQEGDSDCIVMEYVEGRTLDSILSEGPLDPLRVASLGHEIASGLAEAHANGILHRDLKAENIIITPRGRSKILDFGLAKPILRSELDPVLTGKGQLVGTSRAMSPEYVSGDNVDHRSDLFALGVLLYETLTGQSPFKAHNTLATLKQVMLHRQMPVKQLVPKVPQELSDLIDRLLEKDPGDRPQSAHEVALAFGRLTGQISSGAVDQPSSGTQPIFKPTTSTGTPFSASDTVLDLRPRNRWMTVVAVLVALLITAFFLGRYLSEPDKPAIKQQIGEPIRVLLGDFNNATGEEIYDVTVPGLFRTSLEQSETLSLLSQGQVHDALGRMQRPLDSNIDATLGSELAQREGADWLIIGGISRIGSQFAITAQVIRPADQAVRFTKSKIVDNVDGIIDAIQTVGNEVRGNLGETAAEIERNSQSLEKVTTPNFDALRAYSIGFEKSFQDKERGEAIKYLEKALELDPSFAMAHAKLVSIYSNQRDRAKAMEHIQAAKRLGDRLPEVEKFYINGWTYWWTGTPQEVTRNWAQMSELHPREYPAHRNLGIALWIYENDFTGAAAAFKRAFALADASRKPAVAALLGYCLLGSGQSEEAANYFELASATDKWPLIDYLLAVDKRAEAESLIPTALPTPGRRALVYADRGNLPKALSDLLLQPEGGEQTGASPAEFADVAAVLYLQNKQDDLSQWVAGYQKSPAAQAETVGLSTDTSPVTALALAGKLLARSGNTEQSREVAELLREIGTKPALPLWTAHQRMLAAEILLTQGEPEKALAELDTALSLVDLVTLHESRAFCYEKMGNITKALEEWRLIASRRERAFAEGFMSSYGRLFAVASTSLAQREIARLEAQNRNVQGSKEHLALFAARWPDFRSADSTKSN